MTQPINHLIDADIKGFFDNVSHQWLMKFLQVRIKDPSLLLLITEAADRPQSVHTIACTVEFTEEPDAGNLQVRFREGR